MNKRNPKPYQLPDYPDTDVMEKEKLEEKELLSLELNLIVYDNNFTTFHEMEELLQKVCQHSIEESEQTTLLIHSKGKSVVKKGSYKKLKPMLEAILDRKISATIE